MTSHIWKTPETDTRGAEIRPTMCPRQLNFEHWILSMELALCHPSGAQNLLVALRYLDNLCPPATHSCQKDGSNEVFSKFNQGQGATDFMMCNCVCVSWHVIVCVCHSQHTVSSKVWVQCNFCSQDYVSVLLQMYLHMRGCTCYELRYSIIMQLYLIPGNMQQSPCTEATSVSATQ